MNARRDFTRAAFEMRRRRDIARLLPVFGLLLLVSPLVTVFDVAASIAGIPLSFLYIYGTWLVLILLAQRISRRIETDREED